MRYQARLAGSGNLKYEIAEVQPSSRRILAAFPFVLWDDDIKGKSGGSLVFNTRHV